MPGEVSWHQGFKEASQYERQFAFSLAQLIFGNRGSLLDILSSTTLKHGRLKITMLLFGFRGISATPRGFKNNSYWLLSKCIYLTALDPKALCSK